MKRFWLYRLLYGPILPLLDQLIDKSNKIMIELDTLKANALAVKTAVDSAVALLQDLSARLSSTVSPQEVALVAADLASTANALQAAVTAATPPAPQG